MIALRLAPWIAAGLAIVAVLYLVRENGAQSALQSIERQNNEASKAADDRALDYDACLDAGGLWNFGTGKCVRRAVRDRN